MMDLTQKALPNTVTVGGRAYSIHTDYRLWIPFPDVSDPEIPFPDVSDPEIPSAGFAGVTAGLSRANSLGASVSASFDTINAGFNSGIGGSVGIGAASATNFTANFYDTQTEPDAIYKKFKNSMDYGLAGAY